MRKIVKGIAEFPFDNLVVEEIEVSSEIKPFLFFLPLHTWAAAPIISLFSAPESGGLSILVTRCPISDISVFMPVRRGGRLEWIPGGSERRKNAEAGVCFLPSCSIGCSLRRRSSGKWAWQRR